MSIFTDIETELDETGYTDVDAVDDSISIDTVTGPIAAFVDITAILPTADFSDVDVETTDGYTTSVYGFDSEDTVVVLTDSGDSIWCHCFAYTNATDYADGKTHLTPPQEMRV